MIWQENIDPHKTSNIPNLCLAHYKQTKRISTFYNVHMRILPGYSEQGMFKPLVIQGTVGKSKFRTRSAGWGKIVPNFRTCSDSGIIYSFPLQILFSRTEPNQQLNAMNLCPELKSPFNISFCATWTSLGQEISWADTSWVDCRQNNWFTSAVVVYSTIRCSVK